MTGLELLELALVVLQLVGYAGIVAGVVGLVVVGGRDT